jgi:hypothetical protein
MEVALNPAPSSGLGRIWKIRYDESMDEAEFWSALEFRVTRELSGLRQKGGTLWCDGIAPIAFWINEDSPRIEGEAWIGYEQPTPWRFTLSLPSRVRSREEIDWSSLLPPQDVTRWLAFDESRRILQIEPSAAVPNLD